MDGTSACVLLQQLRKNKKICAAFPTSCSFGRMDQKEATGDVAVLPRSTFHLAKFISRKVVEQTADSCQNTQLQGPIKGHFTLVSEHQNAV